MKDPIGDEPADLSGLQTFHAYAGPEGVLPPDSWRKVTMGTLARCISLLADVAGMRVAVYGHKELLVNTKLRQCSDQLKFAFDLLESKPKPSTDKGVSP